MKRIIAAVLMAAITVGLFACAGSDSGITLEGVGMGYGGELVVSVTTSEEGDITKVVVTSHNETPSIGTLAVDELPAKIVEANGTDVDTVSGATITSNAIIKAVNNAIGADDDSANDDLQEQVATDLYRGIGYSTLGGGLNNYADGEDVPYYYLNQVFANTLFDEDGTILAITIDQMEITTPNTSSLTAPHFYGWPGQSYNYDENHDGNLTEITVDEDLFLEQFLGMETKRERGDTYMMASGNWGDQMDVYQSEFVGLNIDQVKEWYDTYTSDVNARPLKISDSSSDEDVAKFDALSQDEQDYIVDVTSSASISLNDEHGNILEAIISSYENREGVADVNKVSAHGTGVTLVGRLGPGTSNDMSTYSYNEVFVYTLFDDDGRILDVKIDQFEVKTGNTDGLNAFIGWPGTSYGDREATFDTLAEQMADLVTKNEQGEGYMMASGSWEDQINVYENLFIGMTADEVVAWYETYCSDVNGRPLIKITEESNEADIAKFDALSTDEQDMIVDAISGASISLNDEHGDIVLAIVKSFENRVNVDVTVG